MMDPSGFLSCGGAAGGGLSLEEMIDTDMKTADFDDLLNGAHSGGQVFSSISSMDSLDLSNLGELNLHLGDAAADWPLDPVVVADAHSHQQSQQQPQQAHQQQQQPHQQQQQQDVFYSYLEDGPGGAASTLMVNPNNVMPVNNNPAATPTNNANDARPAAVAAPAPQQPQHATTVVSVSGIAATPQQQPQRIVATQQPFNAHHTQISSALPTFSVQQPQAGATLGSGVTLGGPPTYTTAVVPTMNGGTTPVGIIQRGGQTKTLKVIPAVGSPIQTVPSSPNGIVGAHGHGGLSNASSNSNRKKNQSLGTVAAKAGSEKENGFPKPAYSYSCLIALALKNSQSGSMSVSEIYKFMCEHFPYFKTAPSGWKNSVRHNLSLNKCFDKIEKPATNGTNQRKGCLWAMNPAKVAKMDDEVLKWSRKDPQAIKKGMAFPHTLESLERGEMVKDYNANSTNSNSSSTGADSEDEEDPRTPTSVSSQGSQGYDSAGSDFVDIEGFQHIPDSSLPELNLQASGGIYEELGDDRLQFAGGLTPTPASSATVVSSTPANGVITIAANSTPTNGASAAPTGPFYTTTAIHGNYSIQPANGQAGANGKQFNTLVVQKQIGQKVFTL